MQSKPACATVLTDKLMFTPRFVSANCVRMCHGKFEGLTHDICSIGFNLWQVILCAWCSIMQRICGMQLQRKKTRCWMSTFRELHDRCGDHAGICICHILMQHPYSRHAMPELRQHRDYAEMDIAVPFRSLGCCGSIRISGSTLPCCDQWPVKYSTC